MLQKDDGWTLDLPWHNWLISSKLVFFTLATEREHVYMEGCIRGTSMCQKGGGSDVIWSYPFIDIFFWQFCLLKFFPCISVSYEAIKPSSLKQYSGSLCTDCSLTQSGEDFEARDKWVYYISLDYSEMHVGVHSQPWGCCPLRMLLSRGANKCPLEYPLPPL
jgi:hypothetical protein